MRYLSKDEYLSLIGYYEVNDVGYNKFSYHHSIHELTYLLNKLTNDDECDRVITRLFKRYEINQSNIKRVHK